MNEPSPQLRATKISLKFGDSVTTVPCFNSPPFYCMKAELPPKGSLLGSNDLLAAYDLSHTYTRFCGPKKMKEDLQSFLPHLYGNFNFGNGSDNQDFSCITRLVEKPPITGKEIHPLSSSAMSSFRLAPGPVDEAYRHIFERRRENEWSGSTTEHQKYKRTLESDHSLDVKRHKPEFGEKSKKEKKKKEKKEKKEKKKKEDKEKRKEESMDVM